MADDLGERTEEPTAKRRAEARLDGSVARSTELSSSLLLLAATVLAAFGLLPALGHFRTVVAAVLADDTLGSPLAPNDTDGLVRYVSDAAVRVGLPALLLMALAAYLIHFAQVGWLVAPRVLSPRLSQLNPINGFKRLFGPSSFFKAGLSIVKIAGIGAVVVLTVYQYRYRIVGLACLDPLPALVEGARMVLQLALRLLAVLLLLGIIDLMYQKWKHRRDLRMTRQQIKDELKQSEGDPDVKRRRFRMQQQIAVQHINAAVPRADVVVTNPEHVSVAIQYDAEKMHAPKVIAKGADFVALRIRQLALIHKIPIVERPPLARALYRQVEVGREIPPDFYHAVAEILAYVYRLQGRMAG